MTAMNPLSKAAKGSLFGLVWMLLLTQCGTQPEPPTPAQNAQRLFTREVAPILQKNCLRCHDGQNPGLLNLSNRASAFLPNPAGQAYIAPGKPDDSLLLEAVSRQGLHQRMMPRLQITLTDMEIGTLREWIQAGAPWPTGPAGSLRPLPNPEQP